MSEIVFIGGPYDGKRSTVSRQPDYVKVGDELYARIDDPETGESLDGYAWEH